LADWYVYQHDAAPLGPLSTELLADAILNGRLSPETWVAAPGGPRWIRALDVPVIADLVRKLPSTPPPRRDSGLRLMPKDFLPSATPALGVPAVYDAHDVYDVYEVAPPTEPMAPSSLPTRPGFYTGGDTLESAGNERRRRK
jgi:hypothetical protein